MKWNGKGLVDESWPISLLGVLKCQKCSLESPSQTKFEKKKIGNFVFIIFTLNLPWKVSAGENTFTLTNYHFHCKNNVWTL